MSDPQLKDSTLSTFSDGVLGFFAAVMSPVSGPCFLHRWPAVPELSECSSVCSEASSIQLDTDQLAWLMRFVLREAPSASNVSNDDGMDDVGSSIRMIQIEQLSLVAVCLAFKEIPGDGIDEFSIPMYTICFYLHFRWAARLHTVFPSIRDRLQILIRRILAHMDALEQTTDQVLSCLDARVAQPWIPDLNVVMKDINNWLVSRIERSHVETSFHCSALMKEFALNSRYPNGMFQSVVNSAMSHHRCIVVSTNAEEAQTWVHTIAMFLSDLQLGMSSTRIAMRVHDVIPDLCLQGAVLDLQDERFAQKFLYFRYPVVVINLRKHFNASEHIVPESLSTALALQRFRLYRLKILCDPSAPTKVKQNFSALRKSSKTLVSFLMSIQRIIVHINNAANLGGRSMTNRSESSSPGRLKLDGLSCDPTNDVTRSVESIDFANDSSQQANVGSGRSVNSTPPLAPQSSPFGPLAIMTPETFTLPYVQQNYSSEINHSEAAIWQTLASRLLIPAIYRWRHTMLLRSVQHACIERDAFLRNSLPHVDDVDTDIFCCLIEMIPLEMAENRVTQAIQKISERMKAF